MSSEIESRLAAIEEKVNAEERLSFDDGLFLEEHVDVLTLGQLANTVRERKNGNLAYYNTNIHLNPTNVCVYRCVFCAFRSDLKAEKAYTFTDDMIRERALEARAQGATEIHVVGGLHHQKPFEWTRESVMARVFVSPRTDAFRRTFGALLARSQSRCTMEHIRVN